MNLSNSEYVLMTNKDSYFVEYLLEYLVVSDSISEAMIFTDYFIAVRFQDMLLKKCKIQFNISTFIK